MSFLKNTVSLLAVFCVVPAAFGATARPSVLNTATAVSATGAVRRVAMPTMTSYITGSAGGVTNNNNGNSGSSNLLDSIECIDAYTECIKSEDVCGEDLSECTTNVLFHGKMPQCVSTLAQCEPDGVDALFGTKNVTDLSFYDSNNSAEYDAEDGEVIRYTYPTDGSVLGQMIISAAIENQYDTQTCVKRYMSCLNKDSVCGADFELCTDEREFKKQALFCDSTLARCQADGVRELFGVSKWSPHKMGADGKIEGSSRVGVAIKDGADLAALNAVSTCYKVVEQCFLGACSANPLRCLAGSNLSTLTAANDIAADGITITLSNDSAPSTPTDVNRYLRTSCQDTIGANKFCHMTFLGKNPSKKDLADVDVQSEVFDDAISERKKYVESKIQDLMTQFDKRAKDKCVETIRSCAMRSCGEGVGSVCYSSVYGANGGNTIAGPATRPDIKTACESVVNTDVNCQYAYSTVIDNGVYSYNYIQNSVFDTLFPEYAADKTNNDPIGVIGSLNSSLSTSYNAAALAQMKKQCQSVATSCVKSMCGTDYQNCYRNRTDILSDLTNTDNAKFDTSMNKVGGVLDYTIVLGLCMNTVKNADVCDEHLKIQKAKLDLEKTTENVWGTQSSVRDGWIDAGGAKKFEEGMVHSKDENGADLCTNAAGDQGVCYDVDANGDVFNKPVMISADLYKTNQATTSLFRELLVDLEYEAQAKYNAKLTKQQNMCLAANSGGVVGAGDMGSTFMWAKLKRGKVPADYSMNGLTSDQIVPSNELYGSFCRVRVTLQSTDPTVSEWLNSTEGQKYATRYFAAGDAFTCGSWIPVGDEGTCHDDTAAGIRRCKGGSGLRGLAQKVGEATYTYDKQKSDTILQTMLPVVGLLGGGIGGAYLGAGIEDGSVFGGLTGKKSTKSDSKTAKTANDRCSNAIDMAKTKLAEANPSLESVRSLAKTAADELEDMDKVVYKNLEYWPDGMTTTVTETISKGEGEQTKYYCGGTEVNTKVPARCVGDKLLADARTEITPILNRLEGYCESAVEDEDANAKKKKGAAAAGAVTTGVISSVLTWGVTRSIIDAQRTKEQQAAIDEFMDSLGSKINCVVGGDSIAVYGDTLVTSME